MPNSIAIAGISDVGRIRRRNEDAFALVPEFGVAVVADGMGGHPGGDVASRIAADTSSRFLSDAAEQRGSRDFVEYFRPVMAEAVRRAHEEIRAHGTSEPELDGMGTTLTAMVLEPGTGAWVIGHVGDSRAYRLRRGAFEQLTRDDTWVQQQIDSGDMRPESARLSPFAHLLTQCLGLEDAPTPQVLDGRSEPEDAYLLCTDGLVGMLEDEQLMEILSNGRGAASADGTGALEALVEAANEAGGHDNITAALVLIA